MKIVDRDYAYAMAAIYAVKEWDLQHYVESGDYALPEYIRKLIDALFEIPDDGREE